MAQKVEGGMCEGKCAVAWEFLSNLSSNTLSLLGLSFALIYIEKRGSSDIHFQVERCIQ